MADSKSRDGRARAWTCVLYPESCVPAWRDALDDLHIQWAESPLHDLDVNPDGEIKKPHWHWLLLYEGKMSYEQVIEVTQAIGATIPQRVQSARGLVRYMAHLDNPDKHQYSTADIIGHGGLDVGPYLKATAATRYECIREMMAYVRESGICEMADLLDYAAEHRPDDWFCLLCDSSAYVMESYIRSCRCRADRRRT